MRVVIAGQGYVGLPLAVRAAEVGHTVVGFDVDDERIKRLAAGESYVDDVSSAGLQRVLAAPGEAIPSTGGVTPPSYDGGVFEVPTSLSPSRVEKFTSCPLAFRFASIEKLPERPSIHATRGSLVHRALELASRSAVPGLRG